MNGVAASLGVGRCRPDSHAAVIMAVAVVAGGVLVAG
jgi:hypothetical protein